MFSFIHNKPGTQKSTNKTDSKVQKEQALQDRVRDCIYGSLMAGAAGDALGYPVEFMSRHSILTKYGQNGIIKFELDNIIKALAEDLFNGCPISEYEPIDTPEKQQWHARYCDMEPAGI